MTDAQPTPARTDRDDADAARTDADAARDDRPVLESRRGRLGAYLRHNGERICRDAVVLATWALVTTTWIQGVGVPRWLCYLVTFVGVVGYTRATSPWSRPYASPDDLEAPTDGRRLQEPEQRNE